ncbi:MAG: hypothetical protein M3270_03060 [Thermoproteota archaeon]|nr:hypothetical protein [Thermoproteota archaeon]
MSGSIAATNGLFIETISNTDPNFQSAVVRLNDNTSAYRVVSWNTRTNILFPDSKFDSASPTAGSSFSLFLIKLENIFINGTIRPLMTAKVTEVE